MVKYNNLENNKPNTPYAPHVSAVTITLRDYEYKTLGQTR